MEYRTLGQTGIQVSTQCLGAMMFGLWGNRDHDESMRIIHAALDAGVNFIDTADVYSNGESEEIVGKALQRSARRRRPRDEGARHDMGSRSEPARATRVAGSAWRSRTACAGCRPTGSTCTRSTAPIPTLDVDETLGVLTDLVREGKVRAIGSSTFPAEQIVEAQWVAERRGRERFRCEQPPYSILARGIERAVLPTCARYGMGVIVWSPLNGGWLTGKYKRGQEWPEGSRGAMGMFSAPEKKHNQRKFDAVEQLEKVAADAGLVDDAPRDRVEPRAPGGDVDDHRTEDDGAAHRSARGRRRAPRRRRCSTASTRSSLRA